MRSTRNIKEELGEKCDDKGGRAFTRTLWLYSEFPGQCPHELLRVDTVA